MFYSRKSLCLPFIKPGIMNKLLLLLTLVACSCNDSSKTKKTVADTASATTPETPDPVPSLPDTILWVGHFAEWNKARGTVINGNYDTSQQIFLTCGSEIPVNVGRDSVNLLANGSCQSEPPHRVLMMIKKKDSIRISGDHLIRIDTTKGVKPTAVFIIGQQEKKMIVDTQTVRRIRKTPYLRDRVFRKNP